jgi:hypothetical protein
MIDLFGFIFYFWFDFGIHSNVWEASASWTIDETILRNYRPSKHVDIQNKFGDCTDTLIAFNVHQSTKVDYNEITDSYKSQH